MDDDAAGAAQLFERAAQLALENDWYGKEERGDGAL